MQLDELSLNSVFTESHLLSMQQQVSSDGLLYVGSLENAFSPVGISSLSEFHRLVLLQGAEARKMFECLIRESSPPRCLPGLLGLVRVVLLDPGVSVSRDWIGRQIWQLVSHDKVSIGIIEESFERDDGVQLTLGVGGITFF